MDDTAALDTTADELDRDDAPEPSVANTSNAAPADEVVDEMLVEEISIDGMCGVY